MTVDSGSPVKRADLPTVAGLLPASGEPESMLELRQEVAELARTLPGDLRRLRVRGGDREIEIEWADRVGVLASDIDRRSAERAEPARLAIVETSSQADESLVLVRAPLVGCYYAAPSPDAEPFVRVDDEVEVGTTVAIIEAMKMMNPILAAESGVVVEVLVSNGESVEYDQILLRLRPREEAA